MATSVIFNVMNPQHVRENIRLYALSIFLPHLSCRYIYEIIILSNSLSENTLKSNFAITLLRASFWRIVFFFPEWFTDEKHLALFSAGTSQRCNRVGLTLSFGATLVLFMSRINVGVLKRKFFWKIIEKGAFTRDLRGE